MQPTDCEKMRLVCMGCALMVSIASAQDYRDVCSPSVKFLAEPFLSTSRPISSCYGCVQQYQIVPKWIFNW